MRITLPLLGALLLGCHGSNSASTTGGSSSAPAPVSPPPSVVPAPASASAATALPAARTDTIPTSAGALTVTPLHHASLLLGFGGKTIAIDPTSEGNANPDRAGARADFVFVTDIHQDHLVPAAIDAIAKPGAITVGPPAVSAERSMSIVLKNGEAHDF
ncbi:MAG TPA: MBL fold metallo-hydrolase, partial [Polyangiaceae bacterium]